MASRYELKSTLTKIAAAYPEWKPPDMNATLEQYEDALEKYPLDLLEKALKSCRETFDFFPHISQIKKAISDLTSNKNTMNGEDFKKTPTSPEMQAFLDEFRQKMVDSGKWNPGCRKNRYYDRQERRRRTL